MELLSYMEVQKLSPFLCHLHVTFIDLMKKLRIYYPSSSKFLYTMIFSSKGLQWDDVLVPFISHDVLMCLSIP